MNYAGPSDIEERLGPSVCAQLTDDTGLGSIDECKIIEALSGAEGEINSYLARRYAVPVQLAGEDALAGLLKSITLDLAEYRLNARRSPVPADVSRKREAAVQWLQSIARGLAVLPSSGELAGNPSLGVSGMATGSSRVMSRTGLEMV